MRFRTLAFSMALVISCGSLAIPDRLAAQRISSSDMSVFDAPGAGSAAGSGFGTFPLSINAGGTIVGHYTDENDVSHGFLRTAGGEELVTFDAPGAGTAAGSGFGTFPRCINASGVIVGHYTDAHNVSHGFVRSPHGKLGTFDAPGAGTAQGSGFGTFPESINDAGVITGHYIDAQRVSHGFLRSASDGKFLTLDAPGASSTPGSGEGTFARSIGTNGAIAGDYTDAHHVRHGFFWNQ